MSFGLGHGRELDAGSVGVDPGLIPPLPDDIADGPPSRGWVNVRGWFARPDRPLEIEIGSGKGTFLLARGEERPEVNILGIEWAREFALYAADRVRRRGLTNVRMLNTDAVEFIRWRVPDGIVRVIHLYFPDPWPKKRHHKRRTVTGSFLAQAHRVLEPGGELRIVTDHDGYWQWMEEHIAGASELFEVRPFAGGSEDGGGELVGTNFERKYRREGRPFHAVTLHAIKAGQRAAE
jgi:tRNA (guanine-N7-)-methyltransferase